MKEIVTLTFGSKKNTNMQKTKVSFITLVLSYMLLIDCSNLYQKGFLMTSLFNIFNSIITQRTSVLG